MSNILTSRFASQWDEFELTKGQVFTEPSMTVPDQSLTIPEIIAKFTRSGMVPATVRMKDSGGNIAEDPEFDALDDYGRVMSAAKAAAASSKAPSEEPSGEAENPAPAHAGA